MGMQKNQPPAPLSFIVDLYSRVFECARWVTAFELLMRLFRPLRGSYVAVEVWTLGNVLFASLALLGTRYLDTGWRVVAAIAIYYGGWRVFEIVVIQCNILLFDEYRAKRAGQSYEIRSFRRIIILLAHNYVEIVLWFSAMFLALQQDFRFDLRQYPLPRVLYESYALMTGAAPSKLEAETTRGMYLIWIQSFVGLFMTLLMLARFIAVLPAPKTLETTEQQSGSLGMAHKAGR